MAETIFDDMAGSNSQAIAKLSRIKGKKIAIYGDSWSTAGYGSLGASYIGEYTGIPVHVSALGSLSLPQIYAQKWDDYDADIYIIEGGLNDVSQGTGGTTFKNTIVSFVNSIRNINENAEIYFVTPPPIYTSNSTQYNYYFPPEFYRCGIWNLSGHYKFGVINSLKWQNVVLGSDNVHPTAESVPYIAEYIIKAIQNFGDEETHVSEFTCLGCTSPYDILMRYNAGQAYIVIQQLNTTATSSTGRTFTIPAFGDTNVESFEYAMLNSYDGKIMNLSYSGGYSTSVSLYENGISSGHSMKTGTHYNFPVTISDFVRF